jgi:hypothetical protein
VRYLLQDSQAVALVIDEAGLQAMSDQLRGSGFCAR